MTRELSSSERAQEFFSLASLVQRGFALVQPGPLGFTSQPGNIGGRVTLSMQQTGSTKTCQQGRAGKRWDPMPAGGRQNRTKRTLSSR